jgi:hypothetical protein
LTESEEAGIPVVGIGLGMAPLQLPQLFPVAVYAPNFADLGSALSVALEVSQGNVKEKVTPQEVSPEMEERVVKSLIERLNDRSYCYNQKLAKSIETKEVSMDFFQCIGNTSSLFMTDNDSMGSNPEEEHYNFVM